MKIEEFDNVKTFRGMFDFWAYCLSFKKIPGYNIEFGVFNGRSINKMSEIVSNENWFGFDSFEGLPEDWKLNDNNIQKIGTFKTKIPKVNKNVKLVKGWFDVSLPDWIENHEKNISFLHIDSDLYSSCKIILDLLNDQIKKGTVIVFDELGNWIEDKSYSNWENGEWKALNEWLLEKEREVEAIARTNRHQAAVRVIK